MCTWEETTETHTFSNGQIANADTNHVLSITWMPSFRGIRLE